MVPTAPDAATLILPLGKAIGNGFRQRCWFSLHRSGQCRSGQERRRGLKCTRGKLALAWNSGQSTPSLPFPEKLPIVTEVLIVTLIPRRYVLSSEKRALLSADCLHCGATWRARPG